MILYHPIEYILDEKMQFQFTSMHTELYLVKFKNYSVQQSQWFTREELYKECKFQTNLVDDMICQMRILKQKTIQTPQLDIAIPLQIEKQINPFPIANRSPKSQASQRQLENGVKLEDYNQTSESTELNKQYKYFYLSKPILECLGIKNNSELPFKVHNDIFSQNIYTFFNPPHQKNVWKKDGQQTIVDYKNYINAHREILKLTPEKNIINVYVIQPILNKEFDIISIIKFLNAYFPNVEFQLQNKPLKLQFQLDQNIINLEYDDHTFSQLNFIKQKNFNTLDGQQILRCMEQKYFPKKNKQNNQIYSILTFIDAPISEGYWEGVVTGVDSEISGSLVSSHGWYNYLPLREIITSSIHEVLHIFCISHCYNWDCVHNYSYEHGINSNIGGQMMVCPSCLQKLYFQLDGFDPLQRYLDIMLQAGLRKFKQDKKWLKEITLELQQNFNSDTEIEY